MNIYDKRTKSTLLNSHVYGAKVIEKLQDEKNPDGDRYDIALHLDQGYVLYMSNSELSKINIKVEEYQAGQEEGT